MQYIVLSTKYDNKYVLEFLNIKQFTLIPVIVLNTFDLVKLLILGFPP